MIQLANETGGNRPAGDGDRRSDRAAGRAVLALTVLYAVHCIVVLAVVAPAGKRTPISMSIGILVSSAATLLSLWAGTRVGRGGRLFGAVLLTVLFLGAAALSAVLAATSILREHPEFVILDTVMATWAIVTLGLLLKTHNVRIRAGARETGQSAGSERI